jgi:hypothetical protein
MVRTEDVSVKRRMTSSAPLRSAAKSPNFRHDPATVVRGLVHARTEFHERNCVRVAAVTMLLSPHMGVGSELVSIRAPGLGGCSVAARRPSTTVGHHRYRR